MTPVDANAEKLHFLTEAQFWIPCCDYFFSPSIFLLFSFIIFIYLFLCYFFFFFRAYPPYFSPPGEKGPFFFWNYFFVTGEQEETNWKILCEQSWAAFVFLKSKSSARIFSEERFQRYFEDNFLKMPRLPVSVKI